MLCFCFCFVQIEGLYSSHVESESVGTDSICSLCVSVSHSDNPKNISLAKRLPVAEGASDNIILAMCMRVKSLQSCPTLWNPMDCSLPDSSVHGILQARILKWVAMPSSRGSSLPRDQTLSLLSPALTGRFFTSSTTWEGHF